MKVITLISGGDSGGNFRGNVQILVQAHDKTSIIKSENEMDG